MVQSVLLEIEDVGQSIIDEFYEINFGTEEYFKSVFISIMLNEEEMVLYENFLCECKDVFVWSY